VIVPDTGLERYVPVGAGFLTCTDLDSAAEVLRLNPKFSLAVHRQRMPIKDPAVLERHIAALRKAGLK
jgi:hypothetical protein